jgi:release factor glutamine methyltransferase
MNKKEKLKNQNFKMTFLELRKTTLQLIKKFGKEDIAYSFLINKFSNKNKIELIGADYEDIDFDIDLYMKNLNEYLNGKPIQKVVGEIKLANIRINLDFNVLIPRLETEELIMKVISKLQGNEKVLDLCCGSGFIGLALKKAKTNLEVTLSDIDQDAILQTKKNSELNNLDVKVIHSNLFENINETFDVIVCNPPYIKKDKILDNEVINYEPSHSLFAEKNGLFFYEKIISELNNHFSNKNKNLIAFEIGEHQAKDVCNLLKQQGFTTQVFKDITNKNRFVFGIKKI